MSLNDRRNWQVFLGTVGLLAGLSATWLATVELSDANIRAVTRNTARLAFVLYIVVCHGYRACWQTASHYRQRARYELSGMEKRIRLVSILAGVLPLAAAVLLLAIGTPSLDVMNPKHLAQIRGLHQLVIALIVSGAIGLYVAETAAARLVRAVRALTLADD